MKYTKSVTAAKKTLKDTMKYMGVPILKYSINYPKFISASHVLIIKKINAYYEKRALSYEKYCKTKLYKMAARDYNERREGYSVHEYEAVLDFEVTYNQSCAISLFSDKYEYTGGAHGNTFRTSQTFDLNTGRELPLSSLFKGQPFYAAKIKEEIIKQIEKQQRRGEVDYFDNYKHMVNKNFNPGSYYLTKEGLAVYFQQYDLAPYAAGIRVFVIPYNKINVRLPLCKC